MTDATQRRAEKQLRSLLTTVQLHDYGTYVELYIRLPFQQLALQTKAQAQQWVEMQPSLRSCTNTNSLQLAFSHIVKSPSTKRVRQNMHDRYG